ncbi:hypothetical protein ACNGUO_003285 [Escherichia coli]
MLRIGQVESSATVDGKYTDGSVAGGIAATRLRAAAFNAIQEELANIVESAGMTLDPDDVTQVLAAFKKQFLSRVNPFADIKADGAVAVATALSNLGLGTAAEKNVGTASGQIPDMSSFASAGVSNVFSSIVIAGNRRIMEGNGSGTFVNGILSFTLPLAYQNTGFTFIPTDIGSGVVSYAAIPASGSVVTIYGKTATGGNLSGEFAFKYMAMGSAS